MEITIMDDLYSENSGPDIEQVLWFYNTYLKDEKFSYLSTDWVNSDIYFELAMEVKIGNKHNK